MKALLRSLADLSLRGKVALALTIVFLGSVSVMLLVLRAVPRRSSGSG